MNKHEITQIKNIGATSTSGEGGRVSRSGLKTFKELYAARFREDLNEADNFRKAQALLCLWLAIYGDPLAIDQEIMELQTNKQNDDLRSPENKQADSGDKLLSNKSE